MAKKLELNTIPELLEDIRQGKMVILMDDEERENEGDLVMAASKVRPEDVNFMAEPGRSPPLMENALMVYAHLCGGQGYVG